MGLRNRAKFNEYNIFFITTTCNKWLHLLSIGNSMSIVVESLSFCCNKYQASITAYVLMPNHIHLLIYFEEGKNRISFMRDFKKFTSTQIRKEIERTEANLLDKIRYEKGKQVFKIWQDRFDELYIITKELFEQKMEYIHNNPLQEHWDLANEPKLYQYSSALFYEENIQRELIVKHYADFF